MSLEAYRACIGRASEPVKNEVEKGAIRKFAAAIGDPDPRYRDEEAAGGRLLAPPTFSRTFDYGRVPGLELPRAGLIHASQEFEYFRPIHSGDVLYCQTRLADVFEKQGRLGRMIFLVFEMEARDTDGNPVVRQTSTVICREAEA
ncbi:MaoC family dehydratase N-terminal domain-containing protein [Alicyclobacillus sp.]|uniref:MaoC family dehydratase N-terminal domain-containing protein n=1 Tax=Alicyclobacillus sp. TaxID=61169 RepID=UPI0025BC8A2C|nr:MaoC family dehydratase N-terminal domain-containing protein [Alicyclobacillus sp.]MCL6516480.1 MaoC family dehydratase N-terminal domain-containing protein [Alicyclobacillus sp.]